MHQFVRYQHRGITFTEQPGAHYPLADEQQLIHDMRNPQSVGKDDAVCWHPTAYNGHDARVHEAQHRNGVFWALVFDCDNTPTMLEGVNPHWLPAIIRGALGPCRPHVYSTASSGLPGKGMRSRVVIPVANAIPGNEYAATVGACIAAVADYTEKYGQLIKLDACTKREGQFFYGPNDNGRPESYVAIVGEGPDLVLPAHVQDDIARMKAAYDAWRIRQAAMAANPVKYDPKDDRTIAHFNRTIDPMQLMQAAGFEYRYTKANSKGEVFTHWHHPHQTTSTAATRVSMENNGWHTMSTTLASSGLGKLKANGSEASGDMFAIFRWAFANNDNSLAAAKYIAESKYGYRGNDPQTFLESLSEHGRYLWSVQAAVEQAKRDELLAASTVIAQAITVEDDATIQTQTGDWGYAFPDGLLGTVAKLIFNSSARPVSQFAIGQALWAAAAMLGSAYNVEGFGLNLFIQIVGDTGVGKGESKRRLTDILRAVAAVTKDYEAEIEYFGNAAPASAEGGRKMFDRDFKSLGTYTDDADSHIEALMNSQPGSNGDKLRAFESSMWDSSGKTSIVGTVSYSKEINTVAAVRAPALTIMRDFQLDALRSYLGSKTVMRGHGPRQIFVTYEGPKTLPQRGRPPLTVPVEALNTLSQMWNNVQLREPGIVVDVEWEAAAHKAFEDMEDDMLARMNVTDNCDVLNRAHINAAKVAALVAVFRNPISPRITLADFHWAAGFVMKGYNSIIKKLATGDVGSGEAVRVSRAIKAVVDYVHMPEGRRCETYKVPKTISGFDNIIPAVYLLRKLKNVSDFKGTDNGMTGERIIRLVIEELCMQDYLVKVTHADIMNKYSIILPANFTQQLYVLGPAMAG